MPALANTTRPGSTSGFAPLRQVAHGGGPSSVAMALITRGAWRSLRELSRRHPWPRRRSGGEKRTPPATTGTHARDLRWSI